MCNAVVRGVRSHSGTWYNSGVHSEAEGGTCAVQQGRHPHGMLINSPGTVCGSCWCGLQRYSPCWSSLCGVWPPAA